MIGLGPSLGFATLVYEPLAAILDVAGGGLLVLQESTDSLQLEESTDRLIQEIT